MKGFFSVALIIFVLFITMFYVTIKETSKPIMFDDSPRLLALKSEEAFLTLDQNLTYNYIDYKYSIPFDCNTKGTNNSDFSQYLVTNYSGTNIKKANDYCTVKVRSGNFSTITSNTFDVNISANINCTYAKDSDLNYSMQIQTDLNFHKRYQSYTDGGFCHFILTDLDSQTVYVDKNNLVVINLYH